MLAAPPLRWSLPYVGGLVALGLATVACVGEEGRVAVRNVRRDAIHHLKELDEIGADEEHRAEEQVQKLTDGHVKQIDELLRGKEAEIMEV